VAAIMLTDGGTVTVSTFGCGFDQVTANGAQQPPLSDHYPPSGGGAGWQRPDSTP
jgi:hypothetical protein